MNESFDENEKILIYPDPKFSNNARIKSMEEYQKLYDESIEKSDEYWYKVAEEFYWKEKPSSQNVLNYNFDINKGDIFVNFLKDGVTNICYNVLDRHIENGLGEKVAFFWDGNDPMDFTKYTYQYVYNEVCKFANLLRQRGVNKGDRVAIYMPMIVELPISMLACARIGAVHSVIFGGYSADSVADRIVDGRCKVVVTADGYWRGLKIIDLKGICDKALAICEEKGMPVERCIVVRHVTFAAVGKKSEIDGCRPTRKVLVNMISSRDEWWHDAMGQSCLLGSSPVEWVEAEHPLFMLYTSGSTGKPKGVLHTTAGYMLYTAHTFKNVFDHLEDDVFWCTADIGWVTGHSYVVYGPMSQACTGVLFEGIPTHPDPGRMWAVVDRYSVSVLYTAPTAIRSLMRWGNSHVLRYSRASLRLLASVGEPINPRAWLWYYRVVGDSRCPVLDTFWQTETGGHVISPLPGATPLLPGSATLPLFGVCPALLNEDGKEIPAEGPGQGYLVFKRPWPGIMRTVYGDHSRFEKTYFSHFPGYYTTGDGATRDERGYYTITGRIDDMLNVSGHLISTAEVESALVSHSAVVEAAVVGAPHDIKGECLYCFITLSDAELSDGGDPQSPTHAGPLSTGTVGISPRLRQQLLNQVRTKIGTFATPDYIQTTPILPKTRSGKIMRRILRKIAANDPDFGDTSTLSDPSCLNLIMEQHLHLMTSQPSCAAISTISNDSIRN